MSSVGVLLFLVALMLAIFLHEGGHFVTAKLFGMKVERFFLGFGTTLWSIRRGETEYGIKLLPLGGFCKIAGMSPYEYDGNFLETERHLRGAPEPAPDPTPPERQFRNKPAWQRAIVLAAGSVTHFLVALVLTYGLLVLIGLQNGPPTTTIQSTVATTASGAPAPAQAAGLRPGDKILAIDGQPITTFQQVRQAVADKAGKRVTITFERHGQQHAVTLVPANQDGRGFLGIAPTLETRRTGALRGIADSGRMFGQLVVDSFRGIGGLIPGLAERIHPTSSVGTGSGGGDNGTPVGLIQIGRFAGQAVAAGQWGAFLVLLIQFNVFVGIFNLLPIPILDGGYLAIVGWQALTKRELDLRKVAPVAAVVVSLLVIFVVVVAWLDITNPVANPFK